MKMKPAAFAVFVFVFGLVAFFYFHPEKPNRPISFQAAPSSKPKPTTAVPPKSPEKRQALVARVLTPGPRPRVIASSFVLRTAIDKPDEVIAETSAAAANGDAAALRYTAEAQHACAFAEQGDTASIRANAIANAAALEKSLAASGTRFAQGSEPSAHIDQVVEQKTNIRDSCLKVPVDSAKSWQTTLASAAAAGDREAKLEYAQLALGQLSDSDRRGERAEYESVRETAFDNLSDLIAAGDCEIPVLEQLEAASPDAAIKYIYGTMKLQQIARLIAANRAKSPSDVAAVESVLEKQRLGLSALVPGDQLSAADDTAFYITQNYCSQ